MLGIFSKGMSVKIPARFQDQNKNPVPMENVIVRIEHFNESHKEMQTILKDSPMEEVVPGQYLYQFTVPPHVENGNYLVRIKAKMIGNRSDIQEATDYFQVRDGAGLTGNEPESNTEPQAERDYGMLSPVGNANDNKNAAQEPKDQFLSEDEIFNAEKRALLDQVNNMKKESSSIKSTRNFVEDLVVDVENKPIPGIHVNVYERNSFMPRSPDNVLVASSITGEDGKWKMALPTGDFVFVYKGIGLRENREFRKV